MSLLHPEFSTGLTEEKQGGWQAPESLALSVSMLLLVAALPPYPASLMVGVVMILASIVHSRARQMGWRVWWARFWQVTIVPASFALSGALAVGLRIKLNHPGESLAGLISLDFRSGAEVLLRSLAGTASIGYLSLSVSIGELVVILRRIGFPVIFADLLVSTARFARILFRSSCVLIRSQLARGGYATSGTARRSVAMLLTGLFVSSIERARRLEFGLAARAGDGELRTLAPDFSISPARLMVVGAMVATIVLVSSWRSLLDLLSGVR